MGCGSTVCHRDGVATVACSLWRLSQAVFSTPLAEHVPSAPTCSRARPAAQLVQWCTLPLPVAMELQKACAYETAGASKLAEFYLRCIPILKLPLKSNVECS